jgi:hypothetical protein
MPGAYDDRHASVGPGRIRPHETRPMRRTEPVAPSSGASTDLRRSGCRSESHRPRTLRARCSGDSTPGPGPGSTPRQTEFDANSGKRGDDRCIRSAQRSKKKCTEPVAPSSGFPTDRRLTPAALRRAINLGRSVLGASSTLCGFTRGVKWVRQPLLANCDFFFSTRSRLHIELLALVRRREKERPAPRGRPQEFAEPGTLSSTFPTSLPLPRSAPRGASTYRRPVLGAGGTLAKKDLASKTPSKRIPRKLRQVARAPVSVRPCGR